MKTSMTALDISVWIAENGESLQQAFVDNVYLIARDRLVLRLRPRGGGVKTLVIEAGRRISFTKFMADVKRVADPQLEGVQRLWRSLLRDCRIEGVEQVEHERVVFLNLVCKGERRVLVAELLPRGVIALLNGSGTIKIVSEPRTMRDRVVRVGEVYSPPPPRRPAVLTTNDIDELARLLTKGKDLVRGVVRGWSLPGEIAEEVIARCGLDKSADPGSVGKEGVECLRHEVLKLLLETPKAPEPCIVAVDGEPIGVYPYIPSHVRGAVKRFNRFDDAIDEYFTKLTEREVVRRAVAELESKIARLTKSIEEVREAIKRRRAELEGLRRVIRAIEENYPVFEELMECLRRAAKQGWRGVDSCEGVVGYSPSRGVAKVKIGGVEVKVDVRMDAIGVYNSLRKRLVELEKAIRRSEEELRRLEEEVEKLRKQRSVEVKSSSAVVRRRSEWFERFHWTITPEGFLVIGGRDASQNRAIIRRYVEPSDIVLHADIQGGSAVVIKTGGKTPSRESIEEAAVLAACYSKAWKSGMGSVDVYWVWGEQVSLSPPSGEYLPRGAFMVYGKRNYIRGVKLELGLGVEKTDECLRVVVGSPTRIEGDYRSGRLVGFVVLVPGDEDPSRVAKRIRRVLEKRLESLRHCVEAMSVDEIAKRIPGRSRVVRIVFREV